MDQINELLREQIAQIVEREIDLADCLITILKVDCASDFSFAKIKFSVLPDDRLGSVLEKLKRASGLIARLLSKKIRLKKMPKFSWIFDNTEKNAGELDQIFSKIEKGENLDEESEKIGFE